jgi:hypothetical protein
LYGASGAAFLKGFCMSALKNVMASTGASRAGRLSSFTVLAVAALVACGQKDAAGGGAPGGGLPPAERPNCRDGSKHRASPRFAPARQAFF